MLYEPPIANTSMFNLVTWFFLADFEQFVVLRTVLVQTLTLC